MINFVIPSLVLRDSVIGVRLSFTPYWHCSHLLCVARNAHVLSGYVECVTRQAASKLEEWLGEAWVGVDSNQRRRRASRFLVRFDPVGGYLALGGLPDPIGRRIRVGAAYSGSASFTQEFQGAVLVDWG